MLPLNDWWCSEVDMNHCGECMYVHLYSVLKPEVAANPFKILRLTQCSTPELYIKRGQDHENSLSLRIHKVFWENGAEAMWYVTRWLQRGAAFWLWITLKQTLMTRWKRCAMFTETNKERNQWKENKVQHFVLYWNELKVYLAAVVQA